jgi:hypothetical protein
MPPRQIVPDAMGLDVLNLITAIGAYVQVVGLLRYATDRTSYGLSRHEKMHGTDIVQASRVRQVNGCIRGRT